MARKSKAEADIERRIEAFGRDPERLAILERAAGFKRSWMELGEILTSVRAREPFRGWGFETFEDYCRRELHLRRATAEKLTLSYAYIQDHAPDVLRRDARLDPIPQPETLAALARARRADRINSEAFDEIEADALSGNLSPSSLARRFRDAEAASAAGPDGRPKQLLRAARRVADLLAELGNVPSHLAADVEEQLGRLIEFLGEIVE